MKFGPQVVHNYLGVVDTHNYMASSGLHTLGP